MAKKIALLGIYHESNTFINTCTTLTDFKNGHWLRGREITDEYQGAHHEIGGIIEVLNRQNNAELIPVMYAEATPGGRISSETYQVLLEEMMKGLEKILPVDACLVVPHGAAVCETIDDMDGHWLSALRDKVGDRIPIVGTLDPHANVSELMTSSTNALIAYKTNPHIDQRQTGMEAAELLMKILNNEIHPIQVLIQLPLAISIEQQHTDEDPCKSILAYAQNISRQKDILSISVLLGFPYSDVSEMGSSLLVVADQKRDVALTVAQQLESYVLSRLTDFVGERKDISSALEVLKVSKKPVLMLDMGDNVGGGAPGNSTYLLNKLEKADGCRFFICIYDPGSVARASQYKEGDAFRISIEGNADNPKVFPFSVVLNKLVEGDFTETAPRHGGQVHFSMGKTAIVSTVKGNVIMLTSLRIAPFSLRQLTAFDIGPENFDVLVAKGVNAPIAAYSEICPTIIKVNTPGVTQADITTFKYNKRRKPLFPFENI